MQRPSLERILAMGHATLTTTEIYTRGDPTEKLDAMESIVPPHLRRVAFQPSDSSSRSSSALRNGEPGWRRHTQERDQVAASSPLLDLPIVQVMGDAH
ncbi:MAG: hypothetical protein E5V16_22825 [Mesorhizobium sp.]|nr:MAG: hypothetical protein E5V16_22825 [Mesorhizobium sp.]